LCCGILVLGDGRGWRPRMDIPGIEVVVGFMVPLCSPFSAEEAGIRVVRVTGDVAMIVGWVVPVMIIKGIVAQRCRVIKGGGSMGWKLRGKGRL